jgi:hypothetical protein
MTVDQNPARRLRRNGAFRDFARCAGAAMKIDRHQFPRVPNIFQNPLNGTVHRIFLESMLAEPATNILTN